MILYARPEKPFWSVVPPEGEQPNPLGYRCAPNAADASYAGARRIEEFIAYGFRTCWLSPSDFTLWWKIDALDMMRLRENFLAVLEHLLLSWYEEGALEDFPTCNFDNEWGEELTFGNSEKGEAEVTLTWIPSIFDLDPDGANVIALDFVCVDMTGQGGSDPLTIFLDPEVVSDRARVRCAIQWARLRNNLPGRGISTVADQRWDALGVPKRELVELPTTCQDFAYWYEGKPD
jgi:hypothetical protein